MADIYFLIWCSVCKEPLRFSVNKEISEDRNAKVVMICEKCQAEAVQISPNPDLLMGSEEQES